MSATDNLQPLQFYHGTSGFNFKPGDRLTPDAAARNSNYTFSSSNHVYVTSDLDSAKLFANMHPNTQDGKNPVVYKVRPTGPVERDENSHPKINHNFQTASPVEVLGRVDD